MIPWVFAVSAVVLALERVAYAIIWQRPDAFARGLARLFPGRDPVGAVEAFFTLFKLLQAAVFLGWLWAHSGSVVPALAPTLPLLVGVALVFCGQSLNLGVFLRLGRVGVFYGNRLGHVVPWRQGFPFSVVRHPQYVGTVLTIWGLFLALRYPAPDWLALPLLETVYYAAGALVEQLPQPSPEPVMPATGSRGRVADPSASPRPR